MAVNRKLTLGDLRGLAPDDLLTRREVATVLNISEHSLWRWAELREGPPMMKIKRTVRYPAGDLLGWLESHKRAG